MSTESLAAYYTAIAPEHDRIYALPDREDEIAELQDMLAELFDGHTVLELACGTGFWTETLALVADSVTATDANPAMLAVARQRGLDEGVVDFVQADAWALPEARDQFTACFAGGWWSHIKREEQEKFLKQLRAKLGKDVLFVALDENFIEGETVPVARTDLEGNTYQILSAGGERYEVLKNFPADSTLRKRFAAHAREVRIERLDYYWLLSCRLK